MLKKKREIDVDQADNHAQVPSEVSCPTSYVRPQRLVIFLEQVVEDECGVLLVRPGYQHLIDSVLVPVVSIVVAIFQ